VPAFPTPINVAEGADIVDKYQQETHSQTRALTPARQSWKLADPKEHATCLHNRADVVGPPLLPCCTRRETLQGSVRAAGTVTNVDEPIPPSAAFRVLLPTFEGPLDLLLHLIRKHELDILELPIAFVTARYLEYLQMMKELDLDVASEYLLMAATLAHIKSKSLLPAAPSDALEEQDEGYQEDPRAELIRRLLEYQKYKAAGDQLGQRPLAGRDVFQRGMSAPEVQGPAPLAGIDLYKLLDAFQHILKRVHGRVALEVTAERITIHERISQLSDFLRVKRACTFEELFITARTRYEVVVTFLALLEMTKLRMTRIYQADPASALHVQFALLDADSPTVPPEADLGGGSGDVSLTAAEADEPEAETDEPEADAYSEPPSDFDDSVFDATLMAAEDFELESDAEQDYVDGVFDAALMAAEDFEPEPEPDAAPAELSLTAAEFDVSAPPSDDAVDAAVSVDERLDAAEEVTEGDSAAEAQAGRPVHAPDEHEHDESKP
jgi:segregation and condensation protein A